MALKKKPADTPTEKMEVVAAVAKPSKYETKCVWMGEIHHTLVDDRDEDGLMLGCPDVFSKEKHNFRALIAEYGKAGYLLWRQVEFRDGNGYLIFIREKSE